MKVTSDLVTFSGEDKAFLMSFQCCFVYNHVWCGTGILLQFSKFFQMLFKGDRCT